MNRKHLSAKIPAQPSTFIVILSALLAAVLVVMLNTGCSKEDRITPNEAEIQPSNRYILIDYQDTLHIDYSLHTDLYNYNNVSFLLKGGGRLDLYSQDHLDLSAMTDSAQLVSLEDFQADHKGVVATITTDLFPYGQYISRGKLTLARKGDQYTLNILGATQDGLGFRCQYSGLIHDLTAPSTQGSLNFDDKSVSFHLGVMTQEGDMRTYHLIGSNPYDECVIQSTVDIAGRDLTISSDPVEVANGNAVSLSVSIPYGFLAVASQGTLQCSRYGDIYTLVISTTTNQGDASGHFTGPIYTE